MALYAKIDCALARDPRLIKVGPLARMLYVQAILYGRENLTDGLVDRVVLNLIAVDIPHPAKLMDTLADVALNDPLLERTTDGWRIPERTWRKWNPTRTEVNEMRDAEAVRKASWRDKRRTNGHRDATATDLSHQDTRVAYGTRDRQPEPEPELELKPPPQPPQPGGGGGGSSDPKVNPNVDTAIGLIVDHEQTHAGTITNITGWRATVRRRLDAEHHHHLDDLAHEHPDWTPEQLAATVVPPTTNGSKPRNFHVAGPPVHPDVRSKALQSLRAARGPV